MAEQNPPLTDDSVSPLFNRMDALMARHRNPASQHHEDIPVLTDIAPEAFDIPILTDVINQELIQKIENIERSLAQAQSAKARRKLEEKLANENELGIPSLMFNSKGSVTQKPAEPIPAAAAIAAPNAEIDLDLTAPHFRTNPRARAAAPTETPVFLDLPLLDLNAIEAAPIIPTAKSAAPPITASEFNFVADDLIIDFSTPSDTAAELNIADFANDLGNSEPELLATIEATEITEARAIESISEPAALEPVLSKSTVIEAAILDIADDLASIDLAIQLDPEPNQADFSDAGSVLTHAAATMHTIEATPSLHWDDDLHEQTSISLSSIDDDANIEITLDEYNEGIEPEALLINVYNDIPNNSIPAVQTEVESESAPEPETSNRLSMDAIAELTAVVGAQLAVDIASEVEQLARQHFSKLMAQFYGDTLRELTSEISIELEARLAPRIVELVRQELASQGLIQE